MPILTMEYPSYDPLSPAIAGPLMNAKSRTKNRIVKTTAFSALLESVFTSKSRDNCWTYYHPFSSEHQ